MDRSLTRLMQGSARVPDGSLVDGSSLDTVSRLWMRSGATLDLELHGYDGDWRNQKYDRQGMVTARLDVITLYVVVGGFVYLANRLMGRRFGDRPAAEGQPAETYRITVSNSQLSWERVVT